MLSNKVTATRKCAKSLVLLAIAAVVDRWQRKSSASICKRCRNVSFLQRGDFQYRNRHCSNRHCSNRHCSLRSLSTSYRFWVPPTYSECLLHFEFKKRDFVGATQRTLFVRSRDKFGEYHNSFGTARFAPWVPPTDSECLLQILSASYRFHSTITYFFELFIASNCWVR